MSAEPTLHVSGAWTLEFTIKVDDLRRALQESGVWDRPIPQEWDGARVNVQSGGVIVANYPEVELLQSPPPAMAAPAGVDFGAFTETLLRIVGLSAVQARTFGTRMAAAPSLFVLLRPEDPASIRSVRLRAGDGTLIHQPNAEGGFGQTTLVWNTPDRLFVLNVSDRLNDDYVLAVADSIP